MSPLLIARAPTSGHDRVAHQRCPRIYPTPHRAAPLGDPPTASSDCLHRAGECVPTAAATWHRQPETGAPAAPANGPRSVPATSCDRPASSRRNSVSCATATVAQVLGVDRAQANKSGEPAGGRAGKPGGTAMRGRQDSEEQEPSRRKIPPVPGQAKDRRPGALRDSRTR